MKRAFVITCLILFIMIVPTQSFSQETSPVLDMPVQAPAEAGSTVTLPVNFTANGNSVSTIIFSVDFDESLLSFDPSDNNFDTIPDAITFNVSPFVFSVGVSYDPADTDGELDFSISDISPPLTALADGVLLTITLNTGEPAGLSEAAVNFSQDPVASFGNTAGQSITGIANNGSVLITPSTETNCFDGLDNDDDGLMDCADFDCTGATNGACTTGQPGICSTGTLTCQGGAETCVQDNQLQTEVCDNLDNDCDGTVDDNLVRATTCGVGECTGNTGMETCSSGTWGGDTCDPFAGAVQEGPQGDASCGDTLDNDCDGQTDLGDGDCQGGAAETNCFDGIDNDNDGMTDCSDTDCVGVTGGTCATGQQGICSTGTLTCQGGAQACVADNQPQTEGCDNLDNDCDGAVDENLTRSTTCGLGECDGNTGIETCISGVWDSDCDPFAGAAPEGPVGDATCSDILDNDCDGLTDESDSDCIEILFNLPPPVNQKLGIPDSVYNNLDEQGCRNCHENPDIVPLPTNVNRHHLRYGLATEEGFCSINSSQACVGDDQCNTNICSLTGTSCSSDLDCLDVEQCGETCVGDSIAPYAPAADGTYECTTCHTVDSANGLFVIAAVRDCLQCHVQIFGEASVHHLTSKAQSKDCQACHGDLVTNIDDGHYIPDSPPSMVTPAPSGGEGVPFNNEGNGAGACNYCHSTGTGELGSVLPGIVDQDPFIGLFGPVEVYTNAETHHSTGLGTYDDRQCLWCHSIDNPGEAPIRRCEGCHGYESLHNIAVDSDDPGTDFIPNTENPGWSHIGNNDDCWGCHGFGAASTAPYSGPTIPYIQSADKTQIYAGTDTQITLDGKNFQNTVDTTTWTSNVTLTAVDGVSVEFTPDVINAVSLIFTVPATTAPGNYHVRAVKEDKQSNPYVISIIPDVAITYMKCDTKSRLLTINGMNFREQYTGAEEHLNIEVDGTVSAAGTWTDTQITVPVADCRLKPVAKVKALFGEEEQACDKGCVQKKRRRRR